MRNAEGHDLQHRRMIHQDFIDFARRYFLSSAADDFLQAARDTEIAFRIHDALVAGPEPAIGVGFAIGFRIVFVARRDIRAANDDFTGCPPFQ